MGLKFTEGSVEDAAEVHTRGTSKLVGSLVNDGVRLPRIRAGVSRDRAGGQGSSEGDKGTRSGGKVRASHGSGEKRDTPRSGLARSPAFNPSGFNTGNVRLTPEQHAARNNYLYECQLLERWYARGCK